MATTTNFGWATPDDTAYVKDGASAMRTLGSAIDTSLGDLKGGATGEVLTKASATDMDFTWGNPGWVTLSTTAISGTSTTTATFSTAYKDLRIIIEDITAVSNATITLFFGNNTIDTGNNYYLNGATTGGSSGLAIGGTASVRTSAGQAIIQVPNYSDTVPDIKFVTSHVMTNNAAYNSGLVDGAWVSNANPINIVRISTGSSSYNGGSIIVQARY